MGSKSLKQTFVLDTCAWLWITQGDARITGDVKAKMVEADWLLSAISVWEVAMLVAKKRIALNCSIERWVDEALLEVPRLTLAPLVPEIAIASCNLQGCPPSDPADRMIIATAMYHKAALVTGDKKIIDYCSDRHLPVVAI